MSANGAHFVDTIMCQRLHSFDWKPATRLCGTIENEGAGDSSNMKTVFPGMGIPLQR